MIDCDLACIVIAGMVGGMLRHMRSLRTMKRDHGRIHTLLEEVPITSRMLFTRTCFSRAVHAQRISQACHGTALVLHGVQAITGHDALYALCAGGERADAFADVPADHKAGNLVQDDGASHAGAAAAPGGAPVLDDDLCCCKPTSCCFPHC